MNRREAVIGLGALAISACVANSPTTPEDVGETVTVNVYEFPGWANPRPEYGKVPGTQSPNQFPWAVMKTKDRVPMLGEYDEALPEIQKYRAELMEYAGISCAVIQVEWRHAA